MKEYEALRLKADAMEMVEGTGLEWWRVIRWRHYGNNYVYSSCGRWSFDTPREQYELAIGILEGKPVWEGDELWCAEYPVKQMVSAITIHKYKWSWNPPKPKTVTVELPTTVAFAMTTTKIDYETPVYHFTTSDLQIVSEACCKALEGVK